jgi:ribosome-associated protein
MSDKAPYPLSGSLTALSQEQAGEPNEDGVDEGAIPVSRDHFAGRGGFVEEMVERVTGALEDKKGLEIVALNVTEIHSLIEVIVIATGSSPRHVRSLVDGVMDAVREDLGVKPRSVEGLEEATWVLVDFAGITVNVFSEEARSYFSLERLWSDAPLVAHR